MALGVMPVGAAVPPGDGAGVALGDAAFIAAAIPAASMNAVAPVNDVARAASEPAPCIAMAA